MKTEIIVFLIAVVIATYVYTAFRFSKVPDPMAQHGMSLTGLIAFGITMISAILSFVIVLMLEYWGCILIAATFPPIIHKIINKIAEDDKGSMRTA